jgi:Outer membrane receptor proteins, mostly Fe transport
MQRRVLRMVSNRSSPADAVLHSYARWARTHGLVRWATALALIALALGGAFHAAAAQSSGGVQGTVLEGEGHPSPGSEVTIIELGLRTRADAEGRFRFPVVPPGSYLIEARSAEGARVVERVSVSEGSATEITLNLRRFFHLEELVVTAGVLPVTREEAYQASDVVTSRDLVAAAEPTLGETLARRPGINSSYAGPGASRPLIRGLGGDRVRVLTSGIGSGDVSSTSPDHAVGSEPRSAERIEILRGPATLLYGSSAIGGVVNVMEANIARMPPPQAFSGYVEGLAGQVGNERTASGALNVRVGPFVIHGSALARETGDYSIPGFAHRFDGVHPRPGEEPRGILQGSALDTRRGSGGFTAVGDRGYLGAAFTGLASTYGVPSHSGDEGPVSIDMNQNRFDVEGALRLPRSIFRQVKLRLGTADYKHSEIEGGSVGTRVLSDSWEGRIEGQHRIGDALSGALGVQVASRDLEIQGDEVFVPPSSTTSAAAFLFEDWEAGEGLRFQAGLRFERQNASSPTQGVSRSDRAVSLSSGVNWVASDVLTLVGSVSRSVKLPNTEELFSNGPHAATASFEIGDPGLGHEAAWNAEVSGHLHSGRVRTTMSLYRTWFAGFIYQRDTGAEEGGLPAVRYAQDDADFMGFEVGADVDLLHHDAAADRHHLTLDLFTDYVFARFSATGEPLPRIPPFRVGGGVSYGTGLVKARAGVTRVATQSRVAPLETPTPGYTLVDASVSYRLFTGAMLHDLTLAASNLTNAEARVHSSFLKDVAPSPAGRSAWCTASRSDAGYASRPARAWAGSCMPRRGSARGPWS